MYQEVLTEIYLENGTKYVYHHDRSTIFAMILGVSFAWIMAYVNVRGKKWIQLLIFMPFIIPSYITTLAWVQFLGENGPIQYIFELLSLDAPVFNLYSIEGIIFMLGSPIIL